MTNLLFILNFIAFVVAAIWWHKTRDFEPAIASLTLAATLLGFIIKFRSNQNKSEDNNKIEEAIKEKPIIEEGQKLSASDEKRETQTGHIVDYVLNVNLNLQITDNEKNILIRFSKFHRGQHTQGYRLDWIDNELLKDIPSSTSHLILENLLDKGYLERWTTKLGNTYYCISDNGRRFLVENRLITI